MSSSKRSVITFFPSDDDGGRQAMERLAQEAERHGWRTRLAAGPHERAQVGVHAGADAAVNAERALRLPPGAGPAQQWQALEAALGSARAGSAADDAASPYDFNPDFGVYERPRPVAHAYNDGDATERRVFGIISGAGDVSQGSDELFAHADDWPTLYHLSPARANLLRPIEADLRGKTVLELGSGCGAISRYLAEAGCDLTCVEGSHRRASITAARCRGLPNVRVFNDNFQQFETAERFDVVTLIGVLEYSRVFIEGEDPIAAALALAHGFLKPDGVLLVAIENKLGLKYFAGAPEDHVGAAFFGIESLYDRKTAVTFGRRELARVLRSARFERSHFYFPFPDYKLPTMVLTEHGEQDADPAVLQNLLSGAFAPNQTGNYLRTFSEGAAWRALVDNGLVGDFANSFLVVARKGDGNWQGAPDDWAFTYSGSRRKSLGKEVRIARDTAAAGAGAAVHRRMLHAAAPPDWMRMPAREALLPGEILFNRLLPIVNRPGWDPDHLVAWLQPLVQLLKAESRTVGKRRVLPGRFFDATPFNLVGEEGKEAGGWRLFDLEWSIWPELDITLPLFRGVFHSLARIGTVAQPRAGTPTGLAALAQAVVEQATGWAVDVQAHLEKEAVFMGRVLLGGFSADGFTSSALQVRPALATLGRRQAGQGTAADGAQPAEAELHPLLKLAARVPSKARGGLIDAHLAAHGGGPAVAIFVRNLDGDLDKLSATLASLAFGECLYDNVKVTVLSPDTQAGSPDDKVQLLKVDPAAYVDGLNIALLQSSCEWVLIVDAGTTFTRAGLLMVVLQAMQAPDCRAVYADELRRQPGGGLGAAFRPGFNLDLLLSLPQNMARHWLVRREVAIQAGGFDPAFADALEFELIVRLIDSGGVDNLAHVDELLLTTDARPLVDSPAERAVLARHLAGRGYASAQVGSDLPGRYRIRYGHAAQPLVSIIVPTKDQLPVLQRCVESLLEKTRYPHYEVLIVDNASETPDARHWLDGIAAMGSAQVRVLRYPHAFNYSAINNMAAREARGEYLVLLNNDTAIVREDWLDELLNHAQRPEVGVVGAKLLYPSGKLQHAGVVLGLRGPADHPFLEEPMDAAGHMHRLEVDQDYSAVTAACLMTRADIYAEVGGLDENAFKVSYNDVDFCLKVGATGRLVVWTPHAVLMHEGSVSQTRVDTTASAAKSERFRNEQAAMYERWLPLLARDPAYNRNLTLTGPGFELEPDEDRGWRSLPWHPAPVVLAFPADSAGCGHYRMVQPFRAMERAGLVEGRLLEVHLSEIALERANPDTIVFQRQVMDFQIQAMQRAARYSRAFKVFELDDYLPGVPLKSAHRDAIPADILKSLRRAVSLTDRFVVSTDALAEAFSDMHRDIRVVRNLLPAAWWKDVAVPKRVETRRKPRVGWAGGISHRGDLELIADVVEALAGEVEWVFFGMCPDRLRPFVHEVRHGVDIEQYPRELARMDLDVAVAPLEHNLFNECKSNLRLLEYGACGFPVVCTDIRCYADAGLPVTRVKNRFKDWVGAIRMYTQDLAGAARAGEVLREVVLRDWTLEGDRLVGWRRAWVGG